MNRLRLTALSQIMRIEFSDALPQSSFFHYSTLSPVRMMSHRYSVNYKPTDEYRGH